ATTMEDIRLRSGASNGSIYHFFSSKEGLAAALYVEAIINYQSRVAAAVERNPGARAGVYAVIESHLDWVVEHPEWARYLMEMRHAEFMATAESDMVAQNKGFIGGFIRWVKPNIESGALRRLPPDLFISQLLGPVQEFVRNWLGGNTITDMPAAKEELAKTAWIALRGEEKTRTRRKEKDNERRV
ncbi:MAG: TetR/AcrR family transcriptional regulator, partial [Candidatus Lindowbacteria bacterium]|nr:TetR/AcrR family transcriptional regulator [Candidatus Lindowbacteria bacterium]